MGNPNQLIVDSETGESIFVDTTGVRMAGTELLRFPGTFDVFSLLIELRDHLRNVDNLTEDEQVARLRGVLGEVDETRDHMLAALSDLGARQRLLEFTETRVAELDESLAKSQSELEDTDYAKVTQDLTNSEVALQVTIALTTRMNNLPSLLQFL